VDFRNVLVTGGAGFVGSRLAIRLRQSYPDLAVFALDNLSRRGSEVNLLELRAHDVGFVHGDIRCPSDLSGLPRFDLMIECSAEPSVHAGQDGSPAGVIESNLIGTMNCLEAARSSGAAVLFLSTSRVYPIEALNSLRYTETDTRFVLDAEQDLPGAGANGIAESFPLTGARSFYGMTKLASEALIQEYVFSFDMPALINRCAVIAGPGQMGKVDQGVVTLWVARHLFGVPLTYTGFGGQGKQVRDILHVDDLFALVDRQLNTQSVWDGRRYNVGGGTENSASLFELTELCRELTGSRVEISPRPETARVDVRIFETDNTKVQRDLGWKPEREVAATVAEISEWIRSRKSQLEPFLGR